MVKLDIGGSSGSKKGNFFEKHFSSILGSIGYEIIKANEEIKEENISKNNLAIHKYRIPPDKFTEIDFYLPKEKVGFCVTNLSRKNRFRIDNKKINEFDSLKGICPHCNKEFKNDNKDNDILFKWTCKNCSQIIFPFDLKKPQSINNEALKLVIDNSAIQQAHKQAYYRVGELLDVKINSEDIKLVEIIYNEKEEWRNWYKVIDLFYDDCFWIFSELKGVLFGSKIFQERFKQRVQKIISEPVQNKKSSIREQIITHYKNLKKNREKTYVHWFKKIQDIRIKNWGENLPISQPIRYSIYGIIKNNGEINTSIDIKKYENITKFLKDDKKDRSKIIPYLKKNNFLNNKNELNENAILKKKFYEDEYKKFVLKIKENRVHSITPDDFWFKNHKEKIINLLNYLFKISLIKNWYKFVMIARNDIKMLSGTPYIDQQYEPLELLTRIKLEELVSKGNIKKIHGEIGSDFKEKSWLSDYFNEGKDISLGVDFFITLKNKKELHIQCKSNSSFKKWMQDKKIHNSGISYKDTKRMISHNMLTGFSYKNKEITYSNNRIFIGILDGNWQSNLKDRFKLIRMMYLMGIDDIFFADEIDDRFEEFINSLSNKD